GPWFGSDEELAAPCQVIVDGLHALRRQRGSGIHNSKLVTVARDRYHLREERVARRKRVLREDVADARISAALVGVLEGPLAITYSPAHEWHTSRFQLEQRGREICLALRSLREQLAMALVVEDYDVRLLDRVALDVGAVGVDILTPVFHMGALGGIEADERLGVGRPIAGPGAEETDHLQVRRQLFRGLDRFRRQRVQTRPRKVKRHRG